MNREAMLKTQRRDKSLLNSVDAFSWRRALRSQQPNIDAEQIALLNRPALLPTDTSIRPKLKFGSANAPSFAAMRSDLRNTERLDQ